MNMLSKLFESNDIGIDFGSANMRAWVKGNGLVLEEPAVAALKVRPDAKSIQVLSVGSEAGGYLGKTPGSIVAVRPFKAGIIPECDVTERMLGYCLAKVDEGKFRKPRVVIAVPSGITEVEKCAVEEAARSAGARNVFLVESIMAAAIGAGIPIAEPKGTMVVDIGASMTKIAVVSLGGIVGCNAISIGGDAMDDAIVAYLRKKYNLLAGEREAEDVKIKIGTACPPDKELEYEIKGIDATEGRRLAVKIDSKEIREKALAGLLDQIEDGLREFIAHIESGLAADIADNGIVLTGGGALLSGLDKRFADATGLSVRVADNPAHATIEGVGCVLEHLDMLAKDNRK